MSDEIDRANDLAQTHLELAIAAARSGPELAATGACLYCDEPLEGGRRFCDAEHRDAYDQERRMRARQGLR